METTAQSLAPVVELVLVLVLPLAAHLFRHRTRLLRSPHRHLYFHRLRHHRRHFGPILMRMVSTVSTWYARACTSLYVVLWFGLVKSGLVLVYSGLMWFNLGLVWSDVFWSDVV